MSQTSLIPFFTFICRELEEGYCRWKFHAFHTRHFFYISLNTKKRIFCESYFRSAGTIMHHSTYFTTCWRMLLVIAEISGVQKSIWCQLFRYDTYEIMVFRREHLIHGSCKGQSLFGGKGRKLQECAPGISFTKSLSQRITVQLLSGRIPLSLARWRAPKRRGT